jgi:hypothetical protein
MQFTRRHELSRGIIVFHGMEIFPKSSSIPAARGCTKTIKGGSRRDPRVKMLKQLA